MYEQTCNEESKFNLTESEEFSFVNSIVKRFIGRGVEKAELFQVGYIGLIKAKKNYKKERNEATFKTYAFYYVEGEIRAFVRQNRCIRLPRTYLKQIAQIKYVNELNEQCGLKTTNAILCLNGCRELSASSCEKNLFNQAITDNDPIEELITKMDIELAMTKLTSTERVVIKLKYFNNESQIKIGDILGLSQSQISRYEKKALSKLRQ